MVSRAPRPNTPLILMDISLLTLSFNVSKSLYMSTHVLTPVNLQWSLYGGATSGSNQKTYREKTTLEYLGWWFFFFCPCNLVLNEYTGELSSFSFIHWFTVVRCVHTNLWFEQKKETNKVRYTRCKKYDKNNIHYKSFLVISWQNTILSNWISVC